MLLRSVRRSVSLLLSEVLLSVVLLCVPEPFSDFFSGSLQSSVSDSSSNAIIQLLTVPGRPFTNPGAQTAPVISLMLSPLSFLLSIWNVPRLVENRMNPVFFISCSRLFIQ